LAGCKGVFSKTSYITIGSKDKPEDYVKKGQTRSVYTGKHFTTAPPKDGKTNDVYFEKKHLWISDGDKYVDRWRYKDSQPDKKKGFLTSDFSKKDEFSNTVRTAQWREQLKQENMYAKKSLQLLAGTDGAPMPTLDSPRQQEEETFLYDLVFEKDDPNFKGASKTHRDTKNKTMLATDRNFGGQMTSHLLSFQAPTDFTKPEHARRPLIRDTFYRKTNIFFPQGVSADPSS